jgi:hypothetical protein
VKLRLHEERAKSSEANRLKYGSASFTHVTGGRITQQQTSQAQAF